MITELNLSPEIHVLRFVKKSIFNTILGFTPYWDYKTYGNDDYIEKYRNLSVIVTIHLKCNCIEVSVLNGVRQPILYCFILDKAPGYKIFCKPETIHNKK